MFINGPDFLQMTRTKVLLDLVEPSDLVNSATHHIFEAVRQEDLADIFIKLRKCLIEFM